MQRLSRRGVASKTKTKTEIPEREEEVPEGMSWKSRKGGVQNRGNVQWCEMVRCYWKIEEDKHMTSNAEEWSSLASQFTMTNTDDGERGGKIREESVGKGEAGTSWKVSYAMLKNMGFTLSKKPLTRFTQKSNKFRIVFLKDTLFIGIYPKNIKTLIQKEIQYIPLYSLK